MRNQEDSIQASPPKRFSAVLEPARLGTEREQPTATDLIGGLEQESLPPWKNLGRLFCFFGVIVALIFAMNFVITSGLRRIKTSAFGVSNRIMEGKVNAQVVITGSSRAQVQYDPRTVELITGHTAFNLGRNGSQTDMQVAFLKAYLAHNRKPQLVVHNLDAFTFVTTREVFDPTQYMPYLYDHALYDAMRKINPSTWKSRYLPLYGYVVEDMNFAWVKGVEGFVGRSPTEDYFLGFNPRHMIWTDDFEKFKAASPDGVRFEIEPAGVQDLQELIRLCKENGIPLIFVYSPEYTEMQSMTSNRKEIFAQFHRLADPAGIPIWDYSDWKYDENKDFFYNSQHLNFTGAAAFSEDLSDRLKTYFASQPRGQ